MRPDEVVHHINEDKLDNRPENLIVFPSQSAHIRHHLRRRRCSLSELENNTNNEEVAA